jgi:hypothetical protein
LGACNQIADYNASGCNVSEFPEVPLESMESLDAEEGGRARCEGLVAG